MRPSNLLIACTLCALALLSQGQVPMDINSITFPNIAASGAKGQWKLDIAIGEESQPGVWYPNTCKTPAFGACYNEAQPAPFNAPLQALGTGLVQVNYTFQKTALVMYNATNQVPATIEFKMCYSNVAFLDRPWRKKNKPIPNLSDNCPFPIQKVPFPATSSLTAMSPADQAALSGSVVLRLAEDDELVSGTYFFMMWLRCADGKICAFESTESPNVNLVYAQPYNGNYVECKGYNPITNGLIVAAAILSAFGPLFFIIYYIMDNMHYAKTGKALSW